MTRLPRPMRGERGGVMVIVALMFGLGVILGAASLAIDTGKLMWERRELQNAADAASFSLAQNCAKDVATCIADDPLIQGLAEENAKDGRHTIERECRSAAVSGAVPECTDPGDMADVRQCPPLPPAYASAGTLKYVEVRTESLSEEGGFVTNLVARAAGNDDQSTLLACARTAWGAPSSASVLPITFSNCEFLDAMASAGYGDPSIDPHQGEIALALNYKVTGKGTTSPCPEGHSGTDAPGGFGWLSETDCETVVDSEGWVDGDTGNDAVKGCFNVGDTVLIPVFQQVTGTGSGTDYRIDGLAAFHITGFRFPSLDKDDAVGADALAECAAEATDGKTCLYGMFLEDYVASGPLDPDGGSSPYGDIVVIQPVG